MISSQIKTGNALWRTSKTALFGCLSHNKEVFLLEIMFSYRVSFTPITYCERELQLPHSCNKSSKDWLDNSQRTKLSMEPSPKTKKAATYRGSIKLKVLKACKSTREELWSTCVLIGQKRYDQIKHILNQDWIVCSCLLNRERK